MNAEEIIRLLMEMSFRLGKMDAILHNMERLMGLAPLEQAAS